MGRRTTIAVLAVAALVALGATLLLTGGGGDGLAGVSEGPLTWDRNDPDAAGQNFGGVAFGPAGFVMVGNASDPEADGFAAVSADGAAWNTIAVPEFTGAQLVGLTSTGSSYLAIGRTLDRPGTPQAWRSTDGASWTRTELTLPDSFEGQAEMWPYGVAGRDGTAVVAALSFAEAGQQVDGLLWTSGDDGATWQRASSPVTDEERPFVAQSAGPGGLVALPLGGEQLWTSRDGSTWSQVTDPPGGDLGLMAGGDQGHLVLVRDENLLPTIWWSADAGSWEQVHELPELAVATPFAGPGGFAVVLSFPPEPDEPVLGGPFDQTYTMLFSPDGRTWIDAAPTGTFPKGSVVEWAAVGTDQVVAGGFPPEPIQGTTEQFEMFGPAAFVGSP